MRSLSVNIIASSLSLGLGSALLVSGPAQAATIAPISQDRYVQAFVIVPQCGDSFSDFDEAPAFNPFNSTVQAERICKAASATANAEQNSIIAGAQLEGEGTSSSQASAMEQDVIHAISVSGYEVTFSVAGASRFTLNAGLDASGAAPVVLSQARVRLNAVGNQAAIFEHISTPGPGGEPNPIVVEDSGELPAGEYTFRADANTVIDSTTPPNGNGNAYFQFVFGVVRIGDVNGDGQVNIDDLLALISAWGECPQPPADCPADLNHDGMVNVHDLLTVINHWG